MRRLPSVPLRLPAAALAAAALLAAGTAVASAATASPQAPARPAAQAKVTWHRLTLLHGWVKSRSPKFDVANPDYALYKGIVYLDGDLKQPAGTKYEFARLPKAERPAHTLYIPVLTGAGAGEAGTLVIKPNGDMQALHGAARTLTSIASVSFPAAHSGLTWHRLPAGNGWSDAPIDGAGRASYAVRGGVVYLAGSLHHGSTSTVGTLPAAARPSVNLYLADYTAKGNIGDILITPAGAVSVYGVLDSTQTSLDGLSYPAAKAKFSWHPIPLTGTWESSNSVWGSGNPSYAVVGPIVYLSGSMQDTSAGTGLFAFMPKASQPAHNVTKLVYAFGGTSGGMTIAQNLGLIGSNPASLAEEYTSFAGFSYPRNA
jgi:hypothetical protein